MFIEIHRGGFASGSYHYDAVGSFRYMEIDQGMKTLQVQLAIFAHRRDDGDEAASCCNFIHASNPGKNPYFTRISLSTRIFATSRPAKPNHVNKFIEFHVLRPPSGPRVPSLPADQDFENTIAPFLQSTVM